MCVMHAIPQQNGLYKYTLYYCPHSHANSIQPMCVCLFVCLSTTMPHYVPWHGVSGSVVILYNVQCMLCSEGCVIDLFGCVAIHRTGKYMCT